MKIKLGSLCSGRGSALRIPAFLLTIFAASLPAAYGREAVRRAPEREPEAVAGPPAPPLGRKLQEVVVLRLLLTMRFSRSDLESALSILRELQQADQRLQARSEQALEEERQSLLTARADGPLPPDSGAVIQQEVARYRERAGSLWTEAAKRIGADRAAALRRIVSDPKPLAPGPIGPGSEERAGRPAPPAPAEGPAGERRAPDEKRAPHRGPGLEPHLPLPDLIALLEQRRTAMAR